MLTSWFYSISYITLTLVITTSFSMTLWGTPSLHTRGLSRQPTGLGRARAMGNVSVQLSVPSTSPLKALAAPLPNRPHPVAHVCNWLRINEGNGARCLEISVPVQIQMTISFAHTDGGSDLSNLILKMMPNQYVPSSKKLQEPSHYK